ncbi:hypothetical protein [Flavobacterium sp.]|uniref:hypothetical protein n=1 Tax=Flavobacterium sp. TaxID=239 RepID=UPI003BC11553
MNKESFDYIKSNFISQTAIKDYNEELKQYVKAFSSNSVNPGAIVVLTDLCKNTEIYQGQYTTTWKNKDLPNVSKILQPDNNDDIWKKFRSEAVIAAAKKMGISTDVVSYLKNFDKSIPQSVSPDDASLNNAWNKWYGQLEYDNNDPKKAQGLFEKNDSMFVLIQYVQNRLSGIDLTQDTSLAPPANEAPPIDETNVDINIERIVALETFLINVNKSSHYLESMSPIDSLSGALYIDILSRNNVSTDGFGPNNIGTNTTFKSFQNLVAPNADVEKLSDSYQKSLFDKIEASGLFDLLSHIDAMQAYGRARLSTLERVKGSGGAANVLDGVRDTAWLQQLTVVLQTLSRDPVTLATIYRYFPELVNFFFTALAVTGDYSNEGKGGGKEDPLNDPQAVLNDLMSALGQANGQNVFTGAWDLINTGQRIEKAIAEFPWRQNIPPISPDIFHLRLGAANFYIPPIGIDVQTQFKASSLGEGALRQKNSPKFNSGYKHTTINLQLFFPNYEEIWGISIKDASKISLKDNFTIDFSGNGDNEEKIDKFLSSLRGLVAAFKYAPFLPIRNQYLNSVYGITGVSLKGMSISTIPSYPFALVVTLNLYNFNHKPFLPMLNDFNQAIHWGKFRQYMGKAAGALHNYINEEFLMVTKDSEVYQDEAKSVLDTDRKGEVTDDGLMAYADSSSSQVNSYPDKTSNDSLLGYKNEVFTTNVVKEWINGSNITFYMPAETQTKIFTPDISGFRSEEEKGITDIDRGFWNQMLANFGIDINESAGYHRNLDSVITTSVGNIVEFTVSQKILQSIDILTAGRNTKDFQKKSYAFLITSFIYQNPQLDSDRKDYLKNYDRNDNAYVDIEKYVFGAIVFDKENLSQIKSFFKTQALTTKSYLDFMVEEYLEKRAINAGKTNDTSWKDKERKLIKDQFSAGFSALVYERFFRAGPIRDLMEAARERNGSFHIREWEVPMIRVDMDPSQAIVTDVSVSMSNNIIPLQVQMHDEPTYQHIGGGDSYINVSMKVFGEKELIKLRKIFDHINGLARLEHAAGVMGFLGIKNVITALAGIKYVLPLSFNISTIPNFPHVYDVTLRLIDFDIFQQKREQLSSDQQRKLIEEFGTKKNPFLRMKQLWGSFNTYPDFPLEIRNKDSEVVGSLDPDFYFRSFEMFDRDVIHNITENKGKLSRLNLFNVDPSADVMVVTPYGSMPYRGTVVISKFKEYIKSNDLDGLKVYAKNTLNLKASEVASYIIQALKDVDQPNDKFLLSYVDSLDEGEFAYKDLADSAWRISSGQLKAGNLSSIDEESVAKLKSAIGGSSDGFEEDNYVSFDPDEINAHAIINTFPATSGPHDSKIPSMMHTADGYQFGYIDKKNGRFYLTVDDIAVKKDSSVQYIGITDTQTPDIGTTKSLTGVPGAVALSEYQYAYSSGDEGKPETMKSNGNSKSVSDHWEKMMIDTQYRDISGRMIRAFPTYMLWLISEGNFAGTKLFDNFYGLQSIIDFSIVSSEDILGDTLVFRASNMYAKLSTKEATTIFSGAGETDEKPGVDKLSLTQGLEQIIDRNLNFARNILGHMESQYIVDIENIRLKPGVRVHLRAGYGSNPNSLHTLFNGVITDVELGEIVTVTCQSDAIELSPIINSVDKKGSSGHIDGGINTGLYLSEPRDLMVRLLSMGASRVKEAFAHATRGTVFSENKFGIKHFGGILYEPLNEIERNRFSGIRNAASDAMLAVGQGSGLTGGTGAVTGVLNPFGDNSNGTGIGGADVRIPTLGIMRTMWSNFASQPDLELFKRNIYPGNGTGVAQFLGGDLGDGWANAASLTPEDDPNPRLEYLNRLTDSSWNQLLQRYDSGSTNAAAAIDDLTQGMESRASGGTAANILNTVFFGSGAALAVSTTGIALPFIGGTSAVAGGAGLLGSLKGRGGVNIWKTFGLISDLDDDMPGFDEVSFRAQTYMKSVWDLFQLCARLLPNYIVAVRPFEDRSTVFYGKPHWLYTSAVVPITTGFPSEKKAIELGLKTPSYRSPDSELMDLLTKINKSSNPTADYEAMRQLNNPTITLESIIQQQSLSSDIYAPAGVLKGKVIDFLDPSRTSYYGNKNSTALSGSADSMERQTAGRTKEIISQIPKNKGFATVGFHLPIDSTGGTASELDIEKMKTLHKEIPQMPLRFSFPYFTDRVAGSVLLDYAFYALSNNRDEGTDRNKTGVIHNGDKDIEKFNNDTIYRNLIDVESSLISGSLTDTFEGASEDEFTINLATISFTTAQNPINTFGNDNYIFSLDTAGSKSMIRMPLPSMKTDSTGLKGKSGGGLEGSWEYEYINQSKITSKSPFSYRDWGSPANSLDEQFHIAMRWPYEIIDDKDDVIFKKFKDQYFPDRKENEFYGKPKDYKNRKVLVYSPTTRTAVVCKPAYFLWGTDKADLIVGANKENDWDDEWVVSPRAVVSRNEDLAAIVSPDAAYYLGIMHLTENEKFYFKREENSFRNDYNRSSVGASAIAQAGLAPVPMPRDCYYAFVDDSIPVGVVTTIYNPANEFKYKEDENIDSSFLIGFGAFSAEGDQKLLVEDASKVKKLALSGSADSMERQLELLNDKPTAFANTQWKEYIPVDGITLLDAGAFAEAAARGGNILAGRGEQNSYFDLILKGEYSALEREELYKILDAELPTTGDDKTGKGRERFAAVYDIASPESVKARQFFDEGFSATTHVIAGNGRTLNQASDIWDQFRFNYHNEVQVKKIFFDAFGIDPDDTTPLPDFLIQLLRNPKSNPDIFKAFNASNGGAIDEFSLLLGSDFINNPNQMTGKPYGSADTMERQIESGSLSVTTSDTVKQAIEFARKNLVDAPLDDGGLIRYFNELTKTKYKKLGLFLQSKSNISLIFGTDANQSKTNNIISDNFTAKQIFLLVVGMFRQAMWQDSYARAWVVLKPNRKYTSNDMWDFGPVNKIFAAFVDPNQDYSSNKKKFLKLLADNKGEGNSAGNVVGVLTGGIDSFWDKNIGPMFTALSDGLSGLMSMFRMSMLQMGYGLSEVDNFAKQANIMNKVLNDSVYYSLGRAGSLLRAIDNPFTREYGEPVVEVREPFQKIHYLSSFSTIIANNIQETTTNVATQVTAVSEGKYPVTVALDKSIPAERQIEKTVETGLYYDNILGDGLFGIAQPLFHPIEFARGAIKLSNGSPDELMSRRVALAHLRESLKDIYSGELIVIGSPDIRPHDLVYLADVYERMYGIFEVEQVVHHFTPNMGFITSITPNALVTVNDPARWFMSSWIHSWMSIQNIRNDTRSIINSVQAGSTGILSGGNISVDGMTEALKSQMMGGIQFTHGSSALMSDIMANFAAEGLTDAQSQIELQAKQNNEAKVSLSGVAYTYLATVGLTATVGTLLGGPVVGGIAAGVVSDVLWKGWKWVRDNVLDQHGCYISYLNKNGQPMDASLAINQGMVVGRYHTKRLLPGILGVRSKVRTIDGHAFIRNDDLLKSLGWKEKEITDLVRHVSYENALVNAEVLKYSGRGPDKTGLNQYFKIICKLNKVIDGDEIEVIDLMNPTGQPFKVRLEGIIASSLGVFQGYTNTSIQAGYKPDEQIQAINTNSPGGRSTMFVNEKLSDKPFVIRISPNDRSSASIYTEDDLSPGSRINNPNSYLKGISYGEQEREKSLGTIFYRILDEDKQKNIIAMRSFFISKIALGIIQKKEEYKKTIFPDSLFAIKFDDIYNSIYTSSMENHFVISGENDPLKTLGNDEIKLFNDLVNFKILEVLYSKASEWPYISWDEYYNDGVPATLNWELVTNNLAQVYTLDLLKERPSTGGLDRSIPMPIIVEQKGGI